MANARLLKQYACLHAHSVHSDGAYTPEELAQVAKDEGYRAFALTDHDTVSGNGDMKRACESLGLECIAGIEFSTYHSSTRTNMHLTAFHFDTTHPELEEYLWQLSEKETDQTRVLFRRGVDIGYIKGITWEDVLEYNKGITWLCN